MQRKLIVACLMLALVTPALAQRGSGGRGSGTKVRQRIHQPGTGQQTGTAVQKRDRKRDGTGVNCPNGPCVQQQTRTEAQVETQARTKAQSQTQSRTQAETQTQTQTRTQQSKPAPKD